MSKRFTDTEKFNDKWYRTLTPVQKCIWEYSLSQCDHAGFLKFDLELMSFQIGTDICIDDLKKFDDRFIFISDELIYIPKFINFQYGILNPENKVHKSVLKILNKYNIQAPCKPLDSSLVGAKDKDKDKDKDKIKEKDNNKKIDVFFDNRIQKVFLIYSEKCDNLCKLTFEKKNKQILDKIGEFLQEIDYDFEYINELCETANNLKEIANSKIDFKSLLNNHIGIMNGKYKQENKKGLTNDVIDNFFAERKNK